jgi:hypothetical protein
LPMPEPAPVTIAVWPANRSGVTVVFIRCSLAG